MSKIALVTGASGGIGGETARALHRDGWQVLLHYNAAEEKIKLLSRELGGAPVFHADYTRPEQIDAMLRAVEKDFGGVDLLVNNAGVACYGIITDIDYEAWRRVFAINVDGMYRCVKLSLPHMIRRQSGKIINVSSIWGISGASCEAAYSATKGAIISFSKALAKELGPSGIAVNCVAPGVIMTDMLNTLSEETFAMVREETPLGRIGKPADVAELIAFLASPKGDFITGQVLSPNGGFVI